MEYKKTNDFANLDWKKEEVSLEDVLRDVITPFIMEAIQFHENVISYINRRDEEQLVKSLLIYGEHERFDNEFSIEEIPNQYWYYLCNGVLYLNDIVNAAQKIIAIVQPYTVDISGFKTVITSIKQEGDSLYCELKEELRRLANLNKK